MAISVNQVVVAGHLTRDIELKYTQSGAAIANIGLAVNRAWRNQEGELQEELSFIDVTVFGASAENAHKYLRKGSPCLVIGRLKQERWETKEGDNRSRLVVVSERIQFLGAANGDSDSDDRPHKGKPSSKQTKHPRRAGNDNDESDGDKDEPF